jgi:lipopolysaccharide export system protein LptA
MSRFCYSCIVLFFLFSVNGILFAQEDDKIITVDHADSLVGKEINGERVQELIGNVKLHQGTIVIRCRRATKYLAANRVALEGEVEVLDSALRMVANRGAYDGKTRVAEAFERVTVEDRSTTLTSDYGKYFVEEKKAYFRSNVTVEDSGSVLTANEITYYRNDQHSIATGNVKITNVSNGMMIFGNHFENFRQQKFSRMSEGPRVIQVDTSGQAMPETLTVTSKVMESYQDAHDTAERLVAIDSVQITRNELAAEAGLSTFYTKLDSIVLHKSPFVWYTADKSEDNQVSGDSIFIKLKKRKLETVYVRGKATALSRADSLHLDRFNQMTGQEIILHFSESKIHRIDVDRTATSLYYLFDGGKPNGLNKTSGDYVTIVFVDGKIDKMKIIAGVEGQYFPEKMVKHRESDYNLQGFNWKKDRPGKKQVKKH